MKGYVILGTDTGVGKTIVSSMVGLYLQNIGTEIMPFKPIETGCVENKMGEDLSFLSDILNTKQKYDIEQIQPYRYSYPCSPHYAAIRENKVFPSIEKILNKFKNIKESIVMEGCGGLLVPIDNKGTTMLDLHKKVNLPAIIVSRSSLGMINHCSMTIELLKKNNIKIAGFITNDNNDLIDEDIVSNNIETIKKKYSIPFLGRLKKINKITKDNLFKALKEFNFINL